MSAAGQAPEVSAQRQPDDLAGRCVLLTGASGGLGRALAEHLAERGVRLVLQYRSREDETRALAESLGQRGAETLAARADLRQEHQVQALVKAAVERFGRIDGLVNGAGVLPRGRLVMQSIDALRETFETNLVGAFCAMKHVGRQMVAQRSGAIVNVSSAVAFQGIVGSAAYAASKAALNALTVVAAKELAPLGIRVNAVAPGFLATGMMEGDAGNADFLRRVPLGRFGRPEEIAPAVAYLLSDASSFMIGQTLVLDGGMLISI